MSRLSALTNMKYPPAKANGFPLDSNIRVFIGLFQS